MESIMNRAIRIFGRLTQILFFTFLFSASTVLGFSQTGLSSSGTEGSGSATTLRGLGSSADLKLLLKTMEDPTERKKLVGQLRALVQQQQLADEKSEEATVGKEITFVEIYERMVKKVDGTIRRSTTEIRAFPHAFAVGLKKLQNKESFSDLVDLGWKLGVALGVAIFFGWITRRYTRRADGLMDLSVEVSSLRKLMSSLGVSTLGLFSPLVVLVTVFLALALLQPSTQGSAVVLTAVWAYFIRSVLLAISRMVFAAHRPNLRFLPLKDETAAYWNVWISRLSGVGVFGYYFVQITGFLGASAGMKDAWFDLYGAVFTIQLIVLILQQRKELLSRIEGKASLKEKNFYSLHITARFFRSYWHLIAIAYLIVGYALLLLDHPTALNLMMKATASTIL